MKRFLYVSLFLILLLSACGGGAPAEKPADTALPPLPATDTPTPTFTPLPTATDTPAPTDTPVPTITPTTGPIIVDDDFSTDSGRFQCDSCVVKDGALIMGPFTAVDSFKPFFALCNDCGIATNYKMSVDTWYADGRSDFGFGLLLREHGDSPIFLATSTWLVYNVFSFDTSVKGGRGWESLMGDWSEGGLRAGRGINNLEVVMQTVDGKTKLSISINGKVRRTLDLPAGSHAGARGAPAWWPQTGPRMWSNVGRPSPTP